MYCFEKFTVTYQIRFEISVNGCHLFVIVSNFNGESHTVVHFLFLTLVTVLQGHEGFEPQRMKPRIFLRAVSDELNPSSKRT